ncbi:hypothetical protein MPSEU_000264500 [Mayamaea pseudoterrestris]|nr:hypothetical protein MPSEU_000264500 [Mayamaea pseudoterrestris]
MTTTMKTLAALLLCLTQTRAFTVVPGRSCWSTKGLSITDNHPIRFSLLRQAKQTKLIADSLEEENDNGDDSITEAAEDDLIDLVEAVNEAVDAATNATQQAVVSTVADAVNVTSNAVEAMNETITANGDAKASSTRNASAAVKTPSPAPSPSAASPMPQNEPQSDLILYLQSLGAITGRGEFASKFQKDSAIHVIEQLEALNDTPQPTMSPLMLGKWELVYSSTQLFRSSPFFMAGRSVCKTEAQAAQYNWFCDMHRKALAMSSIGAVRQIVSPTRLTSEFEVRAGTVPFLNDYTPFSYSGGLPFSIDGAIVSTADLEAFGNAWLLSLDTVEIKGSNVPGLRQLLDQKFKLQSRSLGKFLEQNIKSYSNPRPAFRTTFLSKQFRISRDEDNHAFVYVKTSDSYEPTDYSKVDADLGVGRLLEGFNDAFTKLYI